MQAGEVVVGMNVRYPRTGTTGKVVRIEQIDRDAFAELDTTHLLYRTDQLISFEPKVEKEVKKGGEELEQVAKERELPVPSSRSGSLPTSSATAAANPGPGWW